MISNENRVVWKKINCIRCPQFSDEYGLLLNHEELFPLLASLIIATLHILSSLGGSILRTFSYSVPRDYDIIPVHTWKTLV
jgi:hypothetical protein